MKGEDTAVSSTAEKLRIHTHTFHPTPKPRKKKPFFQGVTSKKLIG